MPNITLATRIRLFLSASLLTIGLFGLSVLLKSGKSGDAPTVVEPISPSVYSTPVNIVTGKGKPDKDFIAKHLESAKTLGVGSLADTSAIAKKFRNGELVEVLPDKGYVIGNMTHSYPYLTAEALLALRTIGASFYEATEDNSYFTVTSLTRTEHTQNLLRRRNTNAAKDESSHCYGVSFDISYIRYNGKREWDYERTQKLEAILAELQERGDIYVLKERKQSCFHVSVR